MQQLLNYSLLLIMKPIILLTHKAVNSTQRCWLCGSDPVPYVSVNQPDNREVAKFAYEKRET